MGPAGPCACNAGCLQRRLLATPPAAGMCSRMVLRPCCGHLQKSSGHPQPCQHSRCPGFTTPLPLRRCRLTGATRGTGGATTTPTPRATAPTRAFLSTPLKRCAGCPVLNARMGCGCRSTATAQLQLGCSGSALAGRLSADPRPTTLPAALCQVQLARGRRVHAALRRLGAGAGAQRAKAGRQ